MNYGFLIDNRVCIGCHACSTACKQENEVPLGVNRTWVKTVEKGAFPSTRRHFQVTRCNHCANPPCVRICPVSAMYQRADGIVDFDPRVCIGCKACLQACPYDAIYVDPDEGTAAKCHYCAHRVEVGLEPACVVVCPEHAIIAGDLDDPTSEISRMVARHPVSVRKPEQGTAPKLFYIDGEQAALTPTAAQMVGSFAFADVASDQALAMHERPAATMPRGTMPVHQPSGATIRNPTTQSVGTWTGPLYVGQRVAEQMVQTTYNAQHKVPWHWPVPAYLVTKAIGAGLPLVMGLFMPIYFPGSPGLFALAAVVSLIFTGLTAALLVMDLERPERFYLILTRPQWSSWLTRGAFILLGHSVLLGAVLLMAVAQGLANTKALESPPGTTWMVVGVSLVLVASSIATAAYTGYLFGQAEGRDLWQSPLLPAHLVVQALVAGASAGLALALLAPLALHALLDDDRGWLMFGIGFSMFTVLSLMLLGALIVDGLMVRFGELGMPHATESAAQSSHEIRSGRYRSWYRTAMIAGHLIPVGLIVLDVMIVPGWLGGTGESNMAVAVALPLFAALLALVGLYAYEYAFVMAPQEVPNS